MTKDMNYKTTKYQGGADAQEDRPRVVLASEVSLSNLTKTSLSLFEVIVRSVMRLVVRLNHLGMFLFKGVSEHFSEVMTTSLYPSIGKQAELGLTARTRRDYGSYPTRLQLASQSVRHFVSTCIRTLFLLVAILVVGVNGAWGQTPKVADGVYYIKNSNSGNWYLWPSVTTNSTTGNPYLTTSNATSIDVAVNQNGVSYGPFDNTYSHWVVKNVGTNTIQLISPKLNKYVVIRQKAYGDRDVWLADMPGDERYTYLVLNNDNSPYKISPYPGLNSVATTTGYSFNSAAGSDRKWLTWSNTSDPDNPKTGEDRPGLIQFYSGGTPTWSFTKDLLPAPTISYDSEANTFTVSYDKIPAGFDILYTTDGSDPGVGGSTTQTYSNTVTVIGFYTLKAVVARYGIVLTETALQPVGIPDTPTITPPTDCNNMVEISAGGAQIYYTLDGTDPDNGSTLYSGPFELNGNATIKAIAYNGTLSSAIATLPYTPTYTAKPIISISGSNVTITGTGTIYYTRDGTDPNTSSAVYSSPVSLSDAADEVIIKAIAKDGIKELSCVVEASYIPAVPGYYALHQNGKGYLKVSSANVSLNNDATFRYADLFDNNGNSIWYVTPQGYLKNGYYYLNVVNDRTLYLSVEPVTKWMTEEIGGDVNGKKHLKTHDLYLCNDGDAITLKSSPSAFYNACPITLTEVSWPDATVANLTVQSPQLVTYLRGSFKQNFSYSFVNDGGTTVSETKKDRLVYATYSYKSGGDNKSTDWDITADGVIYNKKASGNVDVTATYNVLPADPFALAAHPTPVEKSIKLTVQQKALTIDGSKNYLLYSIKGGDSDRYPYDDGLSENDPVKPGGIGGTGGTSVLTDPDVSANQQISWKITADEQGFYSFQNVSSNRYLYYDETPHASSDFGVLRVGATSLPSGDEASKYKFRLYKTSDGDYGTCYLILPYIKQFAVYSYNGVSANLYAALNNADYKSQTPKVVSLAMSGNSTWCIYKYEAEYRIRTDFTISGPATVNVTGNHEFTSEGWYGKYIKESPKTGNGQRGLVIKDSYKNESNVDYLWTVTSLDPYIDISGATHSDGTWTKTTTGNTSTRNLIINVKSLPTSSVSGVVTLQLRGGVSPNVKSSDVKSVGFTILGNGTVTFYEISSLSGITSSSGSYRLTADASDRPGISTFSGVLDCDGHTISGLTAPLFTTLTNGTVRNVNLSGVAIASNSGPTGAIAGTADGGSRIYNVGVLDGEVGSSDDVCGGIVGKLDGSARVINCFSYANITGGTTVGGIVGYNNFASTSSDIRTMVMNCMYYGNITGGTTISPIYGGNIIHNKRTGSANTGLNNYCYFLYDEDENPYVTSINTYNGALGAEKRYLNRFEFFRLTLNSTRSMAAFYITSDANDKDIIYKWVLDKSKKPYPILDSQDYYPSVINPDSEHATEIDAEDENYRNKGRKLGSVTINLQLGGGGAQFNNTGEGVSLKTTSVTRNITDKDIANYNYNYKKIQLPYYNEVGNGNYTNDRVVTGWKIVEINGSTSGSGGYTTGTDVVFENGKIKSTPYNFVDRTSTKKDLYSISGRVFNQGAYWEVPDGVTSIKIEPYWAKAVYLSDANYDVTYSGNTKYGVTVAGSCSTIINSQTVYNDVANAMTALGSNASHTVYDYAVVLVGNFHQYATTAIEGGNNPVTFMSADLDGDCEPDNTLFYYHSGRQAVAPIRFDFLNIPGVGMVKRTHDSTNDPEPGIFKPKSWFEITNTVLIRFGQFEYADNGRSVSSPTILQGGIYEQFVSAMNGNAQNTQYLLIGDNAWFKNFANGCHTNTFRQTPKVPVNVAGGDFENFYLTGIYQPNGDPTDEPVECYIDGGQFEEVAGAGMQRVDGDVTWLINAADITHFFGGGINEAQSITGNIYTVISNSYVDEFYGGPKFGTMSENKKVTTIANGCHFGKYYGAGYGGTSLNRVGCEDATIAANSEPSWSTYVGNHFSRDYVASYKAISTSYDYEYILHSDGNQTVARFFVNFASLSLASTRDVESSLTGCTIGTFYGGGRLGAVNGNINSTLTDCTVTGNAFGAGFSAEVPTVDVFPSGVGLNPLPKYNRKANVFNNSSVKLPTPVTYTWKHADAVSAGNAFDETGGHFILTTVDLSNLGAVKGDAILNIEGSTTIGTLSGGTTGMPLDDTSCVYGGGESSAVNGNTTVTIQGATKVYGSVYGGGKMGSVGTFATTTTVTGHPTETHNCIGKPTSCTSGGLCSVTIAGNAEIGPYGMQMKATGGPDDYGHVFGASKGMVADTTLAANYDVPFTAYVNSTDVTISENAFVKGSVYGGSENGHVLGSTLVKIQGGQIGCGDGKTDRYSTNDWKEESLAECASWDYDEATTGVTYDPYATGEGGATTATDGHTFYGNVFGGGSGVYPYAAGLWLRSAGLVEGNTEIRISGGHILSNVYGGNEQTDVDGSCTITMTGGSVGVPRTAGEKKAHPVTGNLFGAGKGDKRVLFNTWTNVGSSNVTISGGTVYGSVFGGGEDGHVLGNAEMTISEASAEKPTIIGTTGASGFDGNVFGGGRGSSTALTAGVVGGNVTLNVQGGTMFGDVYGGGRLASVGTNFVNPDDTDHYGKLKGDGYGNIVINLTGGAIKGNVYGGCMGAETNPTAGILGLSNNVTVNLNGGVAETARGCSVGYMDGTEFKGGNIFGCNNLNGTPLGTVTVHVYGTQNPVAAHIKNLDGDTDDATMPKKLGRYDLKTVYGGGNMAFYEPTKALSENEADKAAAQTHVIIEGCDETSIQQVYGGGNAASTPATLVDIYSAYEIEEAFGGGNGKDPYTLNSRQYENPGANVGYYNYSHFVEDATTHIYKPVDYTSADGADKDASTKSARQANWTYGSGAAQMNVHGGKVHRVYGGSNTKGNVRISAVTMLEDASGCTLDVDEAYGGGKSAPMDAASRLEMACIPGLKVAYGGAEDANIEGDVQLTITNGTYDRVFGGNNVSGTIGGTITVNIEETGCKPVIIGQLYGGGNQAAYTAPEGQNGPTLNIRSFTSIGEVYGGGYGESATVKGDTYVNIDVCEGKWIGNQDTSGAWSSSYATSSLTGKKTITFDEYVRQYNSTEGKWDFVLDGEGNRRKETKSETIYLPPFTPGKIGAINNVYGGGNAAPVEGNTNVNIGTHIGEDVTFETPSDKSVAERTHEIKGVDIRGNVYGGGNQAEVTGNANVTIGKKTTTTP